MAAARLGRVHQLRDTLALFAVFLSFNHFSILCLLIWFIIATTYRPLMAKIFTQLCGGANNNNVPINNIDNNNNNNTTSSAKKHYRTNNRLLLKPSLHWLVFLLELVSALLIRSHRITMSYFSTPIQSLSLGVIAASAINSSNVVPLYAALCSATHATLVHISQSNNFSIIQLRQSDLVFCLCYHIVFRQFLAAIWLPQQGTNNEPERSRSMNRNSHSTNNNDIHFTSIVTNIQSFQQPQQSTQEKPSLTTTTSKSQMTNQLYQINVNMNNAHNESSYDYEMTNLQTFVCFLFGRKKNYHTSNSTIVAPLWALCITIKTLLFQNYSRFTNIASNVTTNTNSSSINEDSIMSMDLITQNKTDDMNQLNLKPSISSDHITLDTIFNHIPNNNTYKVCIVDIGAHSITFLIENLIDGELIVLVNGLIWSEVSCTLVMERVGDEYVVVNGLVPSCSYDIQFVNRLDQKRDCLITDLMIRTKHTGPQSDTDTKFETLDYSFPSYYHRKFLSPLLTLKHSVLTTNTNLSDERNKIKKTRKEINKKIGSLRQEIDHLKSKLKQNTLMDEKNSMKIDNLKQQLQQNDKSLIDLETKLKQYTKDEASLQNIYLTAKDHHLKKELEFDKIEEKYKSQLKQQTDISNKLKNESLQLKNRNDKLLLRHSKLQEEVDSNQENIRNLESLYESKRRKSRNKRREFRIREINDLEMSLKGLEQDLSRLESENESTRKMIKKF
ncbi:hypothetical protein C6P45_005156 [Maudiozyma exigua]|uniref:Uncharacterized protein n=1 Tax=Maudiozyma exigua TaxID=34358 RepID=A0A9P6W9A0_MAUEX|nr:hypothetical protein C6P45_005156 [Kazachstania exigua]